MTKKINLFKLRTTIIYGGSMKMGDQKSEIEILKNMQDDLSFLKANIVSLKQDVEEISGDIHREVRPEYLKKLEKIEKQKPIKFRNMKELVEFFSK